MWKAARRTDGSPQRSWSWSWARLGDAWKANSFHPVSPEVLQPPWSLIRRPQPMTWKYVLMKLDSRDKKKYDASYILYFIKITKMHWAKQGGGKKADQGIVQSVHCCFRLCSLYIFRQSPFFSWRCSCTLITVTPSPVTYFIRFVHLPSYSHCCVHNL